MLPFILIFATDCGVELMHFSEETPPAAAAGSPHISQELNYSQHLK